MKPTIRGLQKKADKLFATKGKENAKCEVCETLPEGFKYSQLHPHHIVGRRNKTLRWDLRNRVWLCPHHHTLGNWSAHNNPIWFLKWFKKSRPEDYTYLQVRQYIISKFTIEDMEHIIERLEEK